jgi:hypothetical protein
VGGNPTIHNEQTTRLQVFCSHQQSIFYQDHFHMHSNDDVALIEL